MSPEPGAGAREGVGEGEPNYFFANKVGRILHLALQDVTGGEALSAILSSARLQDRLDRLPPNDFALEFPFGEPGRIQQALEELYGPSTGSALARKIGAACFQIGVEDLNPVLGVSDLVFRLLPLRMRCKVGLEVLAHILEQFSDNSVRLEEDDHHFRWVFERCGLCWGRRSDSPCCDVAVGLLEEELYWLSGGDSFHVQEVSCVAAGDPTCTILIDKRPVDRLGSVEEGE